MKGLKKLREKKGITQSQIADACGVKPRTVRNWESGTTKPNKAEEFFLTHYLK